MLSDLKRAEASNSVYCKHVMSFKNAIVSPHSVQAGGCQAYCICLLCICHLFDVRVEFVAGDDLLERLSQA